MSRHQSLITMVCVGALLSGCAKDHCELGMTMTGARNYNIAWSDAVCTVNFNGLMAFEQDGQEFNIHVIADELGFSPGSYPVYVGFVDADGYFWEFKNCVIQLVQAELEDWTINDHWVVDGMLQCPVDAAPDLQISDVLFSVYVPERFET